jgi:UDP-N-acetylglucosamine enolpyruvyl transferase
MSEAAAQRLIVCYRKSPDLVDTILLILNRDGANVTDECETITIKGSISLDTDIDIVVADSLSRIRLYRIGRITNSHVTIINQARHIDCQQLAERGLIEE